MRQRTTLQFLLLFLLASLLGLIGAGAANAGQIEWQGTIETKLGAAKRQNMDGSHRGIFGTGVATINNSAGGPLIHTLRIGTGLTGSAAAPVTDPETTGTIPTIIVTATVLPGSIADLQAATQMTGVIPVRGVARICLFDVACNGFLPLPLSTNNGNTAVGVGGLLTVGGAGGNIRISIVAAPWTVGSGSAVNQTKGGGFKTVVANGFIHGTASASGGGSSTALNSGAVQLISPMQVTTTGISGNSAMISLFSILTLHFVPEPGFLLLLAAGVVGMGLLGRNRMRR